MTIEIFHTELRVLVSFSYISLSYCSLVALQLYRNVSTNYTLCAVMYIYDPTTSFLVAHIPLDIISGTKGTRIHFICISFSG